jgi:hypothetical protein
MKHFLIQVIVVCCVCIPAYSQSESAVQIASPVYSVKARLTDAAGAPVSGVQTYVAVKGSTYDLRSAITDKAGAVEFLLPTLPPRGQLIFQAEPSKGSGLRFETSKPVFTVTNSPEKTNDEYFYQDTSIFYGTADNSYLLDEYTRFATLEEVFREFVAEVRISKQGNDFRLSVLNRPFKSFFDNPPLVLLDGVPVFDINRLMEIDPLKLRKIDVVTRKYYLGQLLNFGIISLFSFDRDLAGYALPSTSLAVGFTNPK